MAGTTQSGEQIPSFESDILPLFKNDMQSVECMLNFDVLLLDYDWFKENNNRNANRVYNKLKPEAGAGRMPLGGPYWPDEQIVLFKSWIDNDCPP
jgi:hypothetical protein